MNILFFFKNLILLVSLFFFLLTDVNSAFYLHFFFPIPLTVATYLGWQVIGYCLREPFPGANLAVSLKLVKRMKDGS